MKKIFLENPEQTNFDSILAYQDTTGLVNQDVQIAFFLILRMPEGMLSHTFKYSRLGKFMDPVKLQKSIQMADDISTSLKESSAIIAFMKGMEWVEARDPSGLSTIVHPDKTAVETKPPDLLSEIRVAPLQSHFTGGGFDPAAYLAGMGSIVPAGGGACGRLPGRFGVLESLLRTVSGGKSLGGLFGLPSTGSGAKTGGSPLEEFVDSMEQSGRRYDSILAGMVTRTAEAFGSMGESGGSFVSGLFNSLAGYVMKLAMTTSAASKAFGALQSMNPFAAAAAAVGLFSIGRLLQREGGGGSAGAGSTTAGAGAGAGAYGASGSTIGGPRVLNIYIDGVRGGSYASVDRTLGRAGVDRELRQRIRELVRTGANPVAA